MPDAIVLLLHVLLALMAVPTLLSCLYLLGLTLLSAAPRTPARSSGQLRFDVFVPSHNEAPVIAHTVANLLRIDWPADRFRVRVIADNCTDTTAALARAAGADVLERHDTSLRGKGYALQFGFQASLDEGWADAVVVVDADAQVSPNLLEAFAARLERGEVAIQAHYGVLNPMASWRTQLITIAKAAFHIVRSRARERLGLSCGIRGNGWCVTHALLRAVPYRAFSLTEDVEFGIELGLAGHRVAYADEACSNAEMVTSETVAATQRQRWEQGRFLLIRARTVPLLLAAIRRRSAVLLDLAVDLIVLPLSYVVMFALALIGIAGLGAWWAPALSIWLWCGAGCIAALVLYVARGWQLSGVGLRGIAALGRVPGFLLWKLTLLGQRRVGWVRTEREKP
jgi:cellulose synthase/poly-beta-1,6-N-acetylglucosamine synthase-like glycosyltransferase